MCNCGQCESCRQAGWMTTPEPPRQMIFADGPEMTALAEENARLQAQRDEAEARYHEIARSPKTAEIMIRLPEDMLEKIQNDALKIGLDNLAAEKANLEEENERLKSSDNMELLAEIAYWKSRAAEVNLHYGVQTMEKVVQVMNDHFGEEPEDVINALQNAGILFRERR